MDKCRICLKFKRNLCSVFEGDSGISFADMLSSVANVKIVEGANENSICLKCRRKLRNLYNFKQEIERSELELNRQLRNFKFDNINEIKAQLLAETGDDKKYISTDVDVNYSFLFDNDYRSTLYRNTTITKIDFYRKCIEHDLDLNTINHETDNDLVDFHDGSDFKNLRNKKIRQKIKRNAEKEDYSTEEKITTKNPEKYPSNLKKVCIKPIILNDIRIIRARPKISKNRRVKCKNRLDICPHCGKMTNHLQSHILIHIGERKHKCSDCNKAFYTAELLRRHQMKHLNAEVFKCDQCVAVFNSKNSLQSHMTSHVDDKNHICPVCNKAFKRKSTLLRHKLIHSSSAKSVKCNLCNMTFLYKGGLRHHMRVHTGERPFKCEICSRPYSYKIDFNRHCLKKHGVFLKQRSVYVLNEEVLQQERALMRDLMLRVQGVVEDGGPINPFQGPFAAAAFNAAVKALGSCQIPMDSVMNC